MVISVDDAALSDAQRNLVYTGVTRGKRLVVLVGQRKALAIAVKEARARKRWKGSDPVAENDEAIRSANSRRD
jgi:exodeoxyribonuclease V alpha subunit